MGGFTAGGVICWMLGWLGVSCSQLIAPQAAPASAAITISVLNSLKLPTLEMIAPTSARDKGVAVLLAATGEGEPHHPKR